MCTHLHVDHVGWNTRLENGRWVPTFPNARYVFAKSEFDYWTEQHAKTPVPPFGDSVLPVVEAKQADIVRDDFAIGDHVRILPTPGHTPGHVAFTFGRGRDDAVFSGDLMHSPLQTRYPELSVKFDVDQPQAAVTRRNFLERYCDTDTLCCTAHFPSPSAGKIRRRGNGFSCEVVSVVRNARTPRCTPLPSGEVANTCERVRGYGLSMGLKPLTRRGACHRARIRATRWRRPLPTGEVWRTRVPNRLSRTNSGCG